MKEYEKWEETTTPAPDYLGSPEEQLFWRAGMMVGIMRLYDLMLIQIEMEHGEELAARILQLHENGEYLFPAPRSGPQPSSDT